MEQKNLPIIPQKSKSYFFFKRVFDFLFALICIIVGSPFLILFALINLIASGFPIFYVSVRIGKNGKPFKMIKYRTMIKKADQMLDDLKGLNESDGPTFKIENDPRMTKIGKFYRKASIDELPQLFNVLIGTMSFVGPRPPLPKEVEQYDEYDKLRLQAKPGITCIWQCSGRNEIKFKDWMRMDVEYLQKRSLWFDFVLILKTIPAVLSEKGAR